MLEWRTSFDRSIRVEEAKKAPPTKPMLRKTVNVGLGPDEIVGGRIQSSASGLLAEVFLQVNEFVEGYRVGPNTFAYRDLRQSNPKMSRKQREFRTTGVVLKISEDWFAGSGTVQATNRALVATALADLLKRERSVSQNDIDHAATHIAIYQNGALSRATDTIVIYDSIYGGLRLTEPLYNAFPEYLMKLHNAAELAGDAAALPLALTKKLRALDVGLATGDAQPRAHADSPRRRTDRIRAWKHRLRDAERCSSGTNINWSTNAPFRWFRDARLQL